MGWKKLQQELQGDKGLVDIAKRLKKEKVTYRCPEDFRASLKGRLLEKAAVMKHHQGNALSWGTVAWHSFSRVALAAAVFAGVTFGVIKLLPQHVPTPEVAQYGELPEVEAPVDLFLASTNVQLVDAYNFPTYADTMPVYKIQRKKLKEDMAQVIAKKLGFSDGEMTKKSDDFLWKSDRGELVIEQQGNGAYDLLYHGKAEKKAVSLENLDAFSRYEALFYVDTPAKNERLFQDGYRQKAYESVVRFMGDVLGESLREESYTSYVVPSTQLTSSIKHDDFPEHYLMVYLHEKVGNFPIFYFGEQHSLESELAFYVSLEGEVLGFSYQDFLSVIDLREYSDYPIITPEEAYKAVQSGDGRLVSLELIEEGGQSYFYNPSQSFAFTKTTIDQIELAYARQDRDADEFFLPVYVVTGEGMVKSGGGVERAAKFTMVLPQAIERRFVRTIASPKKVASPTAVSAVSKQTTKVAQGEELLKGIIVARDVSSLALQQEQGDIVTFTFSQEMTVSEGEKTVSLQAFRTYPLPVEAEVIIEEKDGHSLVKKILLPSEKKSGGVSVEKAVATKEVKKKTTAIEGQVVDEQGVGVEHASVFLYEEGKENKPFLQGRTLSGEKAGWFHLEKALPKQDYLLVITKRGYQQYRIIVEVKGAWTINVPVMLERKEVALSAVVLSYDEKKGTLLLQYGQKQIELKVAPHIPVYEVNNGKEEQITLVQVKKGDKITFSGYLDEAELVFAGEKVVVERK